MKRRIASLILTVMLCLIAVAPIYLRAESVSGDSQLSRLVDNAELLSSAEEEKLLGKLDKISESLKFDIVVVTTDSLFGKTPTAYADDFYDENGYGYGDSKDGVLLLVSIEDRDWYITTTGFGITAITNAGKDYISDEFTPYLSDGEYYEAFEKYADLCEKFVVKAEKGEPYDIGNMPKEPFGIKYLFGAIAAGVVISLIIVLIMKGQLKTVRRQAAANSYVVPGSMKLTKEKDLFLFANVSKVQRPKNNSSGGSSTHTGSSGTTHGGGGGKF